MVVVAGTSAIPKIMTAVASSRPPVVTGVMSP